MKVSGDAITSTVVVVYYLLLIWVLVESLDTVTAEQNLCYYGMKVNYRLAYFFGSAGLHAENRYHKMKS